MIHFRDVSRDQIVWPLSTDRPFVDIKPVGVAQSTMCEVDTHPAYTHDMDTLHNRFIMLHERFPLDVDVTVFNVAADDAGRVNAYTFHSDLRGMAIAHGRERPSMWRQITGAVPPRAASAVVIWGKRTPPHPAVTSFLCGHEYGHLVEGYLNRASAGTSYSDDVLREYAELRRTPFVERAAAGTWHLATQEVFACDFRILVAGIDVEFWPHDGIARPDTGAVIDRIGPWWQEQRATAVKNNRKASSSPGLLEAMTFALEVGNG